MATHYGDTKPCSNPGCAKPTLTELCAYCGVANELDFGALLSLADMQVRRYGFRLEWKAVSSNYVNDQAEQSKHDRNDGR